MWPKGKQIKNKIKGLILDINYKKSSLSEKVVVFLTCVNECRVQERLFFFSNVIIAANLLCEGSSIVSELLCYNALFLKEAEKEVREGAEGVTEN